MQELILHQRLKDEIAKSGATKLRYTDSELHFKSKQLSSSWAPSGQAQLANASRLPSFNRRQQANSNSVQEVKLSGVKQRLLVGSERDLRRSNLLPTIGAINDSEVANTRTNNNNNNDTNNPKLSDKNAIFAPTSNQQEVCADDCGGSGVAGSNCGGCLIRNMNQNLTDLSRMVQEQNEQLQRLKGRCLRSYFERLNVTRNSR